MTYIVPFTCSVKETRNQSNFTYIHVCDKKRKNNNNNNNKTKQRKKKTKHYHEHVTSCRDIFHIGHRSLDRVLHNCIFLVSWNRMLVSTSLESVWIIFTKLSILKIINFCWFIFSMFVQSMTTFSEGPEDVCVIDSCLQNIIFKTRVLVNKSVIFSVRIKSQINLLNKTEIWHQYYALHRVGKAAYVHLLEVIPVLPNVTWNSIKTSTSLTFIRD